MRKDSIDDCKRQKPQENPWKAFQNNIIINNRPKRKIRLLGSPKIGIWVIRAVCKNIQPTERRRKKAAPLHTNVSTGLRSIPPGLNPNILKTKAMKNNTMNIQIAVGR